MKGPIPSAFGRKAVLVGAFNFRNMPPTEDPLEELESLAWTAKATIVGKVVQKLPHFSAATLIGSGKVEEVAALVKEKRANLVIFENELTPGQLRNLEKGIDTQVMDRTELILDIFATHARTNEAKLQVDLARLKYMLPRLIGRKTFMEQIQIAGSDGAVFAGRGPGEKQIEYDRRVIRRRVYELQQKIHEIEERRKRLVTRRTQDNYTVSLVGYTNAGKSTLMNTLTQAGVYVDDKLFATLDTKTKTWELSTGLKVLLSDTVGFISNLPHALVASFHATLEEVSEADLLLHVADASNPELERQIAAVNQVLKDLGVTDKATVLVLNKVDRIKDPVEVNILRNRYPGAVVISAVRRDGIDELEARIEEAVAERIVAVRLSVPVTEGKVLAEVMANYRVIEQTLNDQTMELFAKIPRRELYKFERFQQKADGHKGRKPRKG